MLNARIKRTAQSARSISRFCYVLFQSELIRVRTIIRVATHAVRLHAKDAALQCGASDRRELVCTRTTHYVLGVRHAPKGRRVITILELSGGASGKHFLCKNHTIACVKRVLAANRCRSPIASYDKSSEIGRSVGYPTALQPLGGTVRSGHGVGSCRYSGNLVE
jgi:hypothetical protein